MASEYAEYHDEMIDRFLNYREANIAPEVIDPNAGEGHVFKKEQEVLNLFSPELCLFIPPENRHQWFRSMISSQALAVSVIGTMIRRGDTDLLAKLECDDLMPLATEDAHFWFASFEYAVWWLEKGRRKTQIDLFAQSPNFRLAVECKLTEREIGQCLKSEEGEREAAYSEIAGYKICPRVAMNGATYWHYWPDISNQRIPEVCTDDCPLHITYQLARNVMAAAINPANGEIASKGIALLLYDERNPEFQDSGGADAANKSVKEAIKNPALLRSALWQSLAGLLLKNGSYGDLLEFLDEKYGIEPTKLD